MPREATRMMFISRVPELIGRIAVNENKLIGETDIVAGTGLTRQTVAKWTKQNAPIGNLDPDTVYAFLKFFDVELHELVTLVERPEKDVE